MGMLNWDSNEERTPEKLSEKATNWANIILKQTKHLTSGYIFIQCIEPENFWNYVPAEFIREAASVIRGHFYDKGYKNSQAVINSFSCNIYIRKEAM